MEENVPLEKESRKKFEKTVKGIKKLLKDGKNKPLPVDEKTEGKKTVVKNVRAKDRGVVYVGHIPHGFFEEQMKAYFSQFGKVTNVRVARSKKNGESKGYGFVEFKDKEVAVIVAETMNNYLMDKRLLRAEYIPPEKQRRSLFKGANWVKGKICPGIKNRKREIQIFNKNVSDEHWTSEAKKQLKNLYRTKAKLRANGIDYDFFNAVDIPEALKDFTPGEQNNQTNSNQIPGDKKTKKKEKGISPEDKVTSNGISPAKKSKKKSKKGKSMKKPITPIKTPKAKKTSNAPSGMFVRPLLKFKLDETPEKKGKKDKKGKQIAAKNDIQVAPKNDSRVASKQNNQIAATKDNKPVTKDSQPPTKKDKAQHKAKNTSAEVDVKNSKLHKRESGGIKKKAPKAGKPASAIFADKNRDKAKLKAKAHAMLNSDMVKVVDGMKLGQNKKHGKKNK